MRAFWLLFLCLSAAAAERVDYSYAFAPPHRLTVGLPGASVKTLLDLEPGSLTLLWTYDDLRSVPLSVWKPPRVQWRVKLTFSLDGAPLKESAWRRAPGGAPILVNEYNTNGAAIRLEFAGAEPGAIGRLTLRSTDNRPHQFSLRAELQGGWVASNPAWIEPGRDPDTLLAGQFDRPDRVLFLALGGQPAAPEKKAFTTHYQIPAQGESQAWLIRPHEAYQSQLPQLRSTNWSASFATAQRVWQTLLASGVRFSIPDQGVAEALQASLADLYIMREPLAHNYTGTICGTDLYRSTNPFEPSLTAIALDQMGHHAAAAEGLRVHLDTQAEDGNWNDPQGWAHHMWGAAGMKAWAAMEHYYLTRDRAYLEALYPRLLRAARWQAAQRKTTPNGLLPRGMGDGGLMRAGDYFGVFYPHNFLAAFADRLAAKAAALLNHPAEAAELQHNYQSARAAILASLDQGAISEDGYRWIPGSANNTDGSRWGALYSLTPTGLLEPHHPLIDGTLRKIEATLSPGGQPVHTGWMADGTWPAISLDNLAEAHLRRGNGDAAIAYLYSTLNHATPLTTWCEERGLEPGSTKTAGDRQHLWTPIAVVRFLRDALVFEDEQDLHLAAATARSWLAPGQSIAVDKAPTHFGPLTYQINATANTLRVQIQPLPIAPQSIALHLRAPEKRAPKSVTVNGAPVPFDPACECVRLKLTSAPIAVLAQY